MFITSLQSLFTVLFCIITTLKWICLQVNTNVHLNLVV